MRILRLFWRYLWPPRVLLGDDSNYHRAKRLLDGHGPRFSVTPADVDARLLALKPRTAVERLNDDVDRAVAAAEREMHEEWERRR